MEILASVKFSQSAFKRDFRYEVFFSAQNKWWL
jgi:hypothetical protein